MGYDVHDFEKEVIERSKEIPVLADFWAQWCVPCRTLSPVLEKLAGAESGRWVLAKVDTEEHPEVVASYGISSIPNVKLFMGGKVETEFVGALPEHQIKRWLEKAVPGGEAKKVAEAKDLLAGNRTGDAQVLLEEVIAREPGNQPARVLLAHTLIFTDPEKAAELSRDITDPAHSEMAEALQTFSRLFSLGQNLTELADRPVKQTYLAATRDLRLQNYEAALLKFIEVIRIDRYYDDDGSRKACIAIFKFLGEENGITLAHRREFTGALYV